MSLHILFRPAAHRMHRPSLLIPCLLLAGIAIAAADEPTSAVAPLIKLFQSGRLPAERQATVVEMICNRGNPHDLKVVFDRVVQPDGFTPELRLKAMAWLTEAAATRKVKPAGELAALEKLVVGEGASRDSSLQAAAIHLASTWRDAAVSPALQKLALDAEISPKLQRAAIEGLVAIGDPASRATLEQLAASERPWPIRAQAAAGLAGIDLKAAAVAAANILAAATPSDDSADLIDAFLNRKNGADELAAALADRKLTVDVAKRALRYMYSVGRSDPSLSEVLGNAAGVAADAPPPTPEQVAKIVADVTAKGNPERGERIFRRKDLNCTKCHSVSRAGGQVGPELSAVGGSSPVDYIVNSILNPNLAIKEQFATRVFELSTGKVLTGIVIDRDEVRVNVRDANGQTVTIPVADVDEEMEGKSLMPQGLTKFLTYEELLDLARFVSELGKPGGYAVNQSKTIQRWRLLRDPPPELTDDVPHLENLRQFVLGAAPTDWDSVYSLVAGNLPLDELRRDESRKDAGPNIAILQGEVNVSAGGPVHIDVQSTEAYQVWVDTNAFDSQTQFQVELAPGKHAITLRVELSDAESPSLRVELKTPADSKANFEIVGGA